MLFASKSFTVWSKQVNLFWHRPGNEAEIIPFVNNTLSEKQFVALPCLLLFKRSNDGGDSGERPKLLFLFILYFCKQIEHLSE